MDTHGISNEILVSVNTNPFPLIITKRSPNTKNQGPFSGNLKLANLSFNSFPVDIILKMKVPFEGFTP